MTAADAEPGECPGSVHLVVSMDAEGTITGEDNRFRGVGQWRLDNEYCGSPFGYVLDVFEGRPDEELQASHSVANDGVVAIDERTGDRAAPGTPSHFVTQKTYTVYPERYHVWMREHDVPVPPKKPPSASQTPTAAKGSFQVTDRLRIRYPADEALFYVDPVLRDRYQRLSLKGTAPDAFRDVHWVVNGERHVSGAGQATWRLRPGTHRIELRARHNGQAVRSRTVRIRVVSASKKPDRSAVSVR